MTDLPANLHDPDAGDPALDLARYLDGVLSDADRARIERALAASPALRDELAAMQRVDASLKGMFTPGAAAPLALPRTLATAPRRRAWAPLAAAMLLIGALTAVAWFAWPRGSGEFNARDLYASMIDAGYKPVWICADEQEFITYTREHLGQALRPQAPADIELVGWTYAPDLKDLGFDKYAVVLLARIDGKEVLGVFDPTATGRLPADPEGTLHIYPQNLGPLPMFEVSPLDTPRLKESMQVIEGDTMDIRSGASGAAPTP